MGLLVGASPRQRQSAPAADACGQNGDRLMLCVVSANVQSLLPHQETRSDSNNSVNPLLSKVEALEVQFAEKRFDIVGVQDGACPCRGRTPWGPV